MLQAGSSSQTRRRACTACRLGAPGACSRADSNTPRRKHVPPGRSTDNPSWARTGLEDNPNPSTHMGGSSSSAGYALRATSIEGPHGVDVKWASERYVPEARPRVANESGDGIGLAEFGCARTSGKYYAWHHRGRTAAQVGGARGPSVRGAGPRRRRRPADRDHRVSKRHKSRPNNRRTSYPKAANQPSHAVFPCSQSRCGIGPAAGGLAREIFLPVA